MDWKEEISRDLMALGSPIFMILVLVRIWVADNFLQVFQIVFAGILLGLIWIFYKRLDIYAAMIIVLGIFTALFYNEFEFTAIVIAAGIAGLLGMVFVLKRKRVIVGAVVGFAVSGISYLVSRYVPLENF